MKNLLKVMLRVRLLLLFLGSISFIPSVYADCQIFMIPFSDVNVDRKLGFQEIYKVYRMRSDLTPLLENQGFTPLEAMDEEIENPSDEALWIAMPKFKCKKRRWFSSYCKAEIKIFRGMGQKRDLVKKIKKKKKCKHREFLPSVNTGTFNRCQLKALVKTIGKLPRCEEDL